MSHQAIIAGIDTHKHTHHAAVLTTTGVLIGSREFATTASGHDQLLDWLEQHGQIVAVGVEGTGSFGAAVTRHLQRNGVDVIEVNRPNRQARRRRGKSDALDAENAARAVLAQTAAAVPKSRDGDVEAIRVLRIARTTAVKSRTQAMNAIHSVIVTAPDELRGELAELTKRTLVRRCQNLPLDQAPTDAVSVAVTTTLRTLANRWSNLDEEVKVLSRQLKELIVTAAPELCALPGVGPEVAAQLMITAGDNHDRLTSEAAFARLCGVAPQPASSGRMAGRHRLSRGGDRAANSALYMVVITRMRGHGPTLDYLERRTAEGLSKKEIIRCLKRYVAREVYHALPNRTP